MSREFFISAEIWRDAGIVSDIERDICQKIDEDNYKITPFSKGIDSIGIIINCFPDNLLKAGFGKPRKYISYKKKFADIRLPIPYDDFMSADYDRKYRMVVKNIIDSIRVIDEKCRESKRAEFNGEALIEDFLKKNNISADSLENTIAVIPDDVYAQIRNG